MVVSPEFIVTTRSFFWGYAPRIKVQQSPPRLSLCGTSCLWRGRGLVYIFVCFCRLLPLYQDFLIDSNICTDQCCYFLRVYHSNMRAGQSRALLATAEQPILRFSPHRSRQLSSGLRASFRSRNHLSQDGCALFMFITELMWRTCLEARAAFRQTFAP